jgi:hypothetical protein
MVHPRHTTFFAEVPLWWGLTEHEHRKAREPATLVEHQLLYIVREVRELLDITEVPGRWGQMRVSANPRLSSNSAGGLTWCCKGMSEHSTDGCRYFGT